MNLRRFSTLLGIAVLATASTADAKVHRVFPGQSIQAAIDAARPGDSILVEPGTYQETGNTDNGLNITTNNLRLIGKVKLGQGKHGQDAKVRLLHYGNQLTGIYAAPAGCGPHVNVCPNEIQGFYIRGFTVEGFPGNGIQTRFVNGFRFVRNESVDNLENGLYPTLSANGLLQNNVSYGSLDTAMWVAGSENVRVVGNELYGSPTGLEITVANNVLADHNDIHDNTVGVGLYHPNAAGNPQKPVMANWVIRHNDIYDNNLLNPAPPGSFQAGLIPGYGVLLLGVSDHVIAKNDVAGNDSAGIAVLGWCTATSFGDPSRNCINDPPQADPSANDNLVYLNKLRDNGANPPPLGIPGVDILYIETPPPAGPEPGIGNCFEKNKPKGFTFFSSEPDGLLPTDGC
jgi:Right handed beta helix region